MFVLKIRTFDEKREKKRAKNSWLLNHTLDTQKLLLNTYYYYYYYYYEYYTTKKFSTKLLTGFTLAPIHLHRSSFPSERPQTVDGFFLPFHVSIVSKRNHGAAERRNASDNIGVVQTLFISQKE